MARKPPLNQQKSTPPLPMSSPNKQRNSGMQLYDQQFRRLYINPCERNRFIKAAHAQEDIIRCFCLVLAYTGCRISEALALTPRSLQQDMGVIAFHTLKQRGKHLVREVPIPRDILRQIHDVLEPSWDQARQDHSIWLIGNLPVLRQTAYRWIKVVMKDAGIKGKMASPKGLRHGFGIHAMLSGVQLNMLQKWMGHASIETTSIYANAMGKEERAIARRMWAEEKPAEPSAG